MWNSYAKFGRLRAAVKYRGFQKKLEIDVFLDALRKLGITDSVLNGIV